MTDFSKTLIRCHAIGKIMTSCRGKSNMDKYLDCVVELERKQQQYNGAKNKDTKQALGWAEKIRELEALLPALDAVKHEDALSDTCKTYLIQSYVLSKYGRVMEVKTKQMIKGIISEDDSIELFSVIDRKPYLKNTERISNDFISGTPDLFDGDDIHRCNEIIDIKSSYDIFTFLSNVQKLSDVEDDATIAYYWQLQGYMALTGAKIGTLAYCLVNTPESIIEGEKYALLKRLDVATEEHPDFKRELSKLLANRYFDDISMEERLLTYSVERNDDDIQKIYSKVVKCREFLSEFEQSHLKFSKTYRKKLISFAA